VRQVVRLHVDRVRTSCGSGAPLFEYRKRPLDALQGEDVLEAYRREHNSVSIDDVATGLLEEG
jgi:hypothetical protein